MKEEANTQVSSIAQSSVGDETQQRKTGIGRKRCWVGDL